jgi:hypothetical protein
MKTRWIIHMEKAAANRNPQRPVISAQRRAEVNFPPPDLEARPLRKGFLFCQGRYFRISPLSPWISCYDISRTEWMHH